MVRSMHKLLQHFLPNTHAAVYRPSWNILCIKTKMFFCSIISQDSWPVHFPKFKKAIFNASSVIKVNQICDMRFPQFKPFYPMTFVIFLSERTLCIKLLTQVSPPYVSNIASQISWHWHLSNDSIKWHKVP